MKGEKGMKGTVGEVGKQGELASGNSIWWILSFSNTSCACREMSGHRVPKETWERKEMRYRISALSELSN